MGMFDWVNVPPMNCPNCGKDGLRGWQSKDGPCLMETVDYWSVSQFYTYCEACKAWIQFDRKKIPEAPLSDYDLTVTKPESESGDNL